MGLPQGSWVIALAAAVHAPEGAFAVPAFVDLAPNCARLSSRIGCSGDEARGRPA